MKLDNDLYHPLWELIEQRVRDTIQPHPISRKVDTEQLEVWKRIREQYLHGWVQDVKGEK